MISIVGGEGWGANAGLQLQNGVWRKHWRRTSLSTSLQTIWAMCKPRISTKIWKIIIFTVGKSWPVPGNSINISIMRLCRQLTGFGGACSGIANSDCLVHRTRRKYLDKTSLYLNMLLLIDLRMEKRWKRHWASRLWQTFNVKRH